MNVANVLHLISLGHSLPLPVELLRKRLPKSAMVSRPCDHIPSALPFIGLAEAAKGSREDGPRRTVSELRIREALRHGPVHNDHVQDPPEC